MMFLIAIMIGAAIGSLLLRRKPLPEGTTGNIAPSVKTVRASVDGKPVYSSVMDRE